MKFENQSTEFLEAEYKRLVELERSDSIKYSIDIALTIMEFIENIEEILLQRQQEREMMERSQEKVNEWIDNKLIKNEQTK